MMIIKKVIFLAFFLIFKINMGFSCTLFAAAGNTVRHNGVIIVKNRDWKPDHFQMIKIIKKKNRLSYIGLFAKGGRVPGLKAGVNEKGLVVITATAGVLPRKIRLKKPRTKKLISKLLQCADLNCAIEKVKKMRGPRFILIADVNGIAKVSMSPEKNPIIQRINNGYLTSANHYVNPRFVKYNQKKHKSSLKRYKRINELFQKSSKPLSTGDFIFFSNDQNNGRHNSIYRRGSRRKRTRTLSTFLVDIASHNEIYLWVKLMNPQKKIKYYKYDLKKIFSKKEE